MPRLKCPHCGGHSWVGEDEHGDIVQRCLCGLLVYLHRDVGGGVFTSQRAVKQEQVRLPQSGTKIHRCLIALAEQHPTPLMTSEIADKAGLKNKETTALVVALMARGLVERLEERRGLAGGSIWTLTHATKKLLGIKGGQIYGISS